MLCFFQHRKNTVDQKQDERNRQNVSNDTERDGAPHGNMEQRSHNEAAAKLQDRKKRNKENNKVRADMLPPVICKPCRYRISHCREILSCLCSFQILRVYRSFAVLSDVFAYVILQEIQENLHLFIGSDGDSQVLVDACFREITHNDVCLSKILE